MTELILFTAVFIYFTNWFQINTLTKALISHRKRISLSEDAKYIKVIYNSTGLKLNRITVFETDQLFGMMAGIPGRPELILSRGLIRMLTDAEMEWVLLHEAAHHLFWHNPKALLIEVIFLAGGFFTYFSMSEMIGPKILILIIIAVITALLCIQSLRYIIEYQADRYAISKVSQPQAVISAQDKFILSPNPGLFSKPDSIGRKLLHWNILPQQRIAIARKFLPPKKR